MKGWQMFLIMLVFLAFGIIADIVIINSSMPDWLKWLVLKG